MESIEHRTTDNLFSIFKLILTFFLMPVTRGTKSKENLKSHLYRRLSATMQVLVFHPLSQENPVQAS